MNNTQTAVSATNQTSFEEFFAPLKATVQSIFRNPDNQEALTQKRIFPPHLLEQILAHKPLSVSIPQEYGGRGTIMRESIATMAMASYESLALSLTFGINQALFLQPVAKYGQPSAHANVFKRFMENKNMGGLMITEPDFGSDALNMQTRFQETPNYFQLSGKKHWAGLTGLADFWLLTARRQTERGDLQRDIDFFIADNSQPEQHIEVEEYFDNLGLYPIPYGRNKLEVKIPHHQRLIPNTTGVMMMLDLLHRSRFQFPGMALGFIHRLLDEALEHCQQRLVGGKPLMQYDQVQERIARLQASYTICSVLCAEGAQKAGIEHDLTNKGLEANSVKTLVTELMQESAQSVTQLVGAKAYKLSHIAGRSIVDSRPFQIFEGSNDILFIQIADNILKQMKKAKCNNIYQFLKTFDLTLQSADRIKKQLDFTISETISQRKTVDLGQIISRAIVLNIVLEYKNVGFNSGLIENASKVLVQDIQMFTSRFSDGESALVVENYQENSNWIQF